MEYETPRPMSVIALAESLIHRPDETPAARHVPAATRLAVRDADRIVLLRPSDADWFQAARNGVDVHVRTLTYRLRVTLGALMEYLHPTEFVRIHKSAIVNLDRVQEFQPVHGGDYIAVLTDGQQLRVSRTYARELLRPIR